MRANAEKEGVGFTSGSFFNGNNGQPSQVARSGSFHATSLSYLPAWLMCLAAFIASMT